MPRGRLKTYLLRCLMMFQMPFINGNSNEPMTKSGWEDVLAAFLSSLIWGKVIRPSIKATAEAVFCMSNSFLLIIRRLQARNG